MRNTVDLDEKDIAAAIKSYLLTEKGMTTVGGVSFDVDVDDRTGAKIISASVGTEPVKASQR